MLGTFYLWWSKDKDMSKDTKHPKTSASIALDRRATRVNSEGKHPVAIRVVFKRDKRDFSIGEFLTKSEWDLFVGGSKKELIKSFRDRANEELSTAKRIISDLGEDFTFDRFKESFKGLAITKKQHDVYSYYQAHIDEIKEQGRFGTARSYQCGLNSLKVFKPRKLEFKEIDLKYIKKYEAWFLNKGSYATLGIYLRPLRAVLKKAVKEGLMKAEHYPFDNYSIKVATSIKKALNIAEIKKIFDYETSNEGRMKARDLWLFSYLCNGMNIKDVSLLRYKDLNNDGFYYVREKTKMKVKDQIFVPLLPQSRAIIDKWGNPDKAPENLVFDIVESSVENERSISLRHQKIKIINKHMKAIADELGIDKPCSTYYARHSFATVLKRSGASTESISEALGHQNISTTKSYLDSFETDEKIKMQQSLVNF